MASAELERNILLGSLASGDLALMARALRQVDLKRQQRLAPANEPITHIYFLTDGVGSVVSRTAIEGMTEVGIFGPEGLGAVAPLLGADRSPLEIFIQSEWASAYEIEIGAFKAAIDASGTLRDRLLQYIQTFLVQTAQSATSNAHQRIEARLARWLLMCNDRLEGDEIRVTHEFIGMMIAADRSIVTLALHVLEGERLVRADRGKVTVLDRAGIHALAGDGYGQAEAEYRRLIAPFGKG